MPSEHTLTVSCNLRTATVAHTQPRANDLRLDTRRFASIFPLEVVEVVTTDSTDATDEEERGGDSDVPSRWEFVTAFEENASAARVASTASSTLSAAQQVIGSYRAARDDGCIPRAATAVINDKDLPRIPDDQDSMYTLATPGDVQGAMDMMWRPKPKVHIHRTDQQALRLAQSQAIAMAHDAGLKPTDLIQCRRRGCADILLGVEALKCHLHIHNIADVVDQCALTPRFTARKPFAVECNTNSKPSKKISKESHARSVYSKGTQRKYSAARSPPRQPSANSLLSSLFSPRESPPEARRVPIPILTTVTNAFDFGPSASPPNPPPVHSNLTPSTYNSTPRGRQPKKESLVISVETECNPTVATLVSPPASPNIRVCLPRGPHTSFCTPLVPNPIVDGESVRARLKSVHGPTRALSPTRAMSPIRDGIRRVLSLGRHGDFDE